MANQRAALRVVDFPREELRELDLTNEPCAQGEGHSLHQLLTLPNTVRAELAAFLIERYSRGNDIVLDPFGRAGSVALEAALRGRVAYLADRDPLAIECTRAKVEPADLADITIFLQQTNLRRPIDSGAYQPCFRPFYDLETFREIVNLKSACAATPGITTRFARVVAMSILHGHSAGYLSAYSMPQVALLPEEQEELNCKRAQSPDTRPVTARIIKRAAAAIRDGDVMLLSKIAGRHRIHCCDARDLKFIPTPSVQLVITTPPLPQVAASEGSQWLRRWFMGIPTDEVGASISSVSGWCEFMNESLLELARAVRRHGVCALVLPDIRLERGKQVSLEDRAVEVVSRDLSRYWSIETRYELKSQAVQLKHALRSREDSRAASRERVVILRRR